MRQDFVFLEDSLARRTSVVVVFGVRGWNNVLDIGGCHDARRRRVLDRTSPHSRTRYLRPVCVDGDYGLISINLIRNGINNKSSSLVHGEREVCEVRTTAMLERDVDRPKS